LGLHLHICRLEKTDDILYPKFADFMEHGSEGGVYESDNAMEKQRKVLDTLVTTNMGALFMKKIFKVKYV